MSKTDSGYFDGTSGESVNVWKYVTPTQPNYEHTEIPRSFIIETENGTFGVHGNATEHMADYVVRQYKDGASYEAIKLDSQIILSDMQRSLRAVTKDGVKYDTPLKHGNWEFVIKESKSSDEYDAVIHALYKK